MPGSADRLPIGVGLLGLGTIGSGVMTTLAEQSARLEKRLGRKIVVRQVLVRDLDKQRSVAVGAGALTTNAADVLEAEDIDVVVELMGGIEPAREYMESALRNGKHLVTANKDVMANHGVELLGLAGEMNLDLFFEASVGGGIPLIGPFRQDLAANEITEIHAIINGTTNYILTRMDQDGTPYETALREAQDFGYAEPDPANDVEGHDAAYKLGILAGLAFGVQVHPDDIYREGIGELEAVDFVHASNLGYAIKLLAIGKAGPDGVEVRVHPTLVTRDFLLSQVSGVENAVRIRGDLLGHAVFAGRGAGPKPTASAIVADLIDLAHNLNAGVHARVPIRFDSDLQVMPMGDIRSRYYLRIWVADQPGVLAQIGRIFGDSGISIAGLDQKEVDASQGAAELVILTHEAVEADMQGALRQMKAMDVVNRIDAFLRVEDLEEEE
jgi:homoserine dehydrogenase